MNKCPNCSRELKTEDNFCPACGFDCREERIVAKFIEKAEFRGKELQPLFRLAMKSRSWFKRYFMMIFLFIMIILSIWYSQIEPDLLTHWIRTIRSAENPIEASVRVLGAPTYVYGLFFAIITALLGNRIIMNYLAMKLNMVRKKTGDTVTEVYEDRIIQKTGLGTLEIQYGSVYKVYRTKNGIGLRLKGDENNINLFCLLQKFLTKGDFDELTAFLE